MLGGLGTSELLLVLVIVMIIFGAGKLPDVGASLGKGIRNFRRASKGEEDRDVTPETPASTAARQQISDQSVASASAASESKKVRDPA